MNIIYKLKWRRGDLGFWHSLNVIGHQYETGSNKLIAYFPDGGLREIAHWNDCEMILGSDWSKLINDDSGNVDVIKDKLIIQQKITPTPIDEKTSEEEGSIDEKISEEEGPDDRTSP